MRVKFTLEIEVDVQGVDLPSDLPACVDQIFGDWNDGRYPYSVETIRLSFREVLATAIEKAIYLPLTTQYAGQMVAVSESSWWSKAAIECEKLMRNLSVRVAEIGRCSEFTEVNPDESS